MSRFFTKKITHEELAEKLWNKSRETEKTCGSESTEDDYAKCTSFMSKCYALPLLIPYFSGKVQEDLSKVRFDWENYEYDPDNVYMNSKNIAGFKTLSNGLTFLGITAGGDWECPIFLIIYFDGKELRAYIPKEGNTWNTDTNEAYGNDNIADAKNMAKRFNPDLIKKFNTLDEYDDSFYDEFNLDFNETKIIEDIENRIKFK